MVRAPFHQTRTKSCLNESTQPRSISRHLTNHACHLSPKHRNLFGLVESSSMNGTRSTAADIPVPERVNKYKIFIKFRVIYIVSRFEVELEFICCSTGECIPNSVLPVSQHPLTRNVIFTAYAEPRHCFSFLLHPIKIGHQPGAVVQPRHCNNHWPFVSLRAKSHANDAGTVFFVVAPF